MPRYASARVPIDPARLRYAREQRGLTIQALGGMVGVCLRTIQRYEKGMLGPTPALLDRLALHLQVRPEWLCGEDGEMEAPRLQSFLQAQATPTSSLFDMVARIVAMPREDRAALLRLLQSEAQATG